MPRMRIQSARLLRTFYAVPLLLGLSGCFTQPKGVVFYANHTGVNLGVCHGPTRRPGCYPLKLAADDTLGERDPAVFVAQRSVLCFWTDYDGSFRDHFRGGIVLIDSSGHESYLPLDELLRRRECAFDERDCKDWRIPVYSRDLPH